jgi:hypothetical protein
MKKKILLPFIFLLYACPNEIVSLDQCNLQNRIANINGLSTITPLQSTYSIGDEVLFSLSVPSENNYFGNVLDIRQNILNQTARLESGIDNLFKGNDVTVIKGEYNMISDDLDRMYLLYNFENNSYELIVKIKFLKPDNYSLNVRNEKIFFIGNPICNAYIINTTVAGHNEDFLINFTVQ